MHEFLPSTKVILFAKLSDLPEYKDSFMNIKLDYCKCIRIYEKAPYNQWSLDLFFLELPDQLIQSLGFFFMFVIC